MNPLYIVLFMVLLAGLMGIIWRLRAKKFDQDPANIENDQKAEEKYAALCENGEEITVVCRGYYKGEYYVLTNKRLIIDNKKGFNSIPLETITNVNIRTASTGKVRYPHECQMIMFSADKKSTGWLGILRNLII